MDETAPAGETTPTHEVPPASPGLPAAAALSEEQRGGLRQLAEDANEKLFKAGAAGAEQSFGLGCLVFALPVLVVDGLLLIFRVFNLILALIVLTMGALVVMGLVTLMAYSARARRTTDVYKQEVGPEIERYLGEHGLSRGEFDQVARETLSEDAPLSAYLAPLPARELSQDEDLEE